MVEKGATAKYSFEASGQNVISMIILNNCVSKHGHYILFSYRKKNIFDAKKNIFYFNSKALFVPEIQKFKNFMILNFIMSLSD